MVDKSNTSDKTAVDKAVDDTTKQSSQAFFKDVMETWNQGTSNQGTQWYGDNNTPGDKARINAAMQANGFLPDFQITGIETAGAHKDQIDVVDKTTGAKGYINNNGVVVDEQGRVIEATYQSTPDHPQGTTQRYTYSGNDKEPSEVTILQSVQGKEGAVVISQTKWSRQADGWHQQDDDGKDHLVNGKPVISNSVVSVEKDGTYKITNSDRSVETYNLDGSSKVEKADGSYVEKDRDGHVIATKSAAGKEWKFAYTNGKISSIELDGRPVTQNPDGTYQYNTPMGNLVFDHITPDQFGGVDIGTINPDGSRYQAYINPDGSKFLNDPKTTMAIQDKSGETVASFTNGEDGKIQTLKTHKSGNWTRQNDGSYSSDEGATATDISTDKYGTVCITYQDGHRTYIYSSGNQTSVANPLLQVEPTPHGASPLS
jgi:hypothetical protein